MPEKKPDASVDGAGRREADRGSPAEPDAVCQAGQPIPRHPDLAGRSGGSTGRFYCRGEWFDRWGAEDGGTF